MQSTRQSQAADYRQRAARVRRGAECARPGQVRDILFRLAAKYDEIAAAGGEAPVGATTTRRSSSRASAAGSARG
jgi:hypothetical protein